MQVSIDQHLNASMTMLQQSISRLSQSAPANLSSGPSARAMPVASHPLTSAGLAPPSMVHQGPVHQAPVTLHDLASNNVHRRSSFGQDTPGSFFPQPSWSSIDTSSCQGHMQPDWLSSAGPKPAMPNLPPGPLMSRSISQSEGSVSALQGQAQEPRRQGAPARSQQKPAKDVKLGWQSGTSAASSGGRATPDGPAALSPKASQSPRASQLLSASSPGDAAAAPTAHHHAVSQHAAPSLSPPPDSPKPHSRMLSPQMSGSQDASAPCSLSGAGSLAAPLRHTLSTSPLQQKLTDTLQRKHSGSLQRMHPELQKATSPGSRHQRPQHAAPGFGSSQASPFAAAAFPADGGEQMSADQAAPCEQIPDALHQGSPFAAPTQQAKSSSPAHAPQPNVHEMAAEYSDGSQLASPFATAAAQHRDSTRPTRSAPVQPLAQQSAAAGLQGGRMSSPFAAHATQHRPAYPPDSSEFSHQRPGFLADVPSDGL